MHTQPNEPRPAPILIDFADLKKRAKKYQRNSTLEEAGLMAAAVDALEYIDHCGGRESKTFSHIYETVKFVLSID